MSLIPDKIIFIDSLEKLLEDIDPDNAFKQLLTLLKDFPGIKIIGTSRTYAIDLVIQKFGIDVTNLSIVKVKPLNEEELIGVSSKFPVLQDLLKNNKIKKLLESPKYLDFSLRSIDRTSADLTSISITDFKEKLWEALVKNSVNRSGGMPAKR